MTLFKKGDMKYDYRWTARAEADDPRVRGPLDSTRFDRHEGYEMLYLVNSLAAAWEFRTLAGCQKIERLIRKHLPTATVMQREVRSWIAENWEKYE